MMGRTMRSTRRAFCCALVIAGWLCPATASTQSASESTLKAAFLYNFARFTEWPADELEPGTALTICVADPPVADALEAMVVGKSVTGHALTVSRLVIDGAVPDGGRRTGLHACAMLYLGRLDLKVSQGVLAKVATGSVLTVSDVSGFTQKGGVARFFVDGANMRFEINLASARRARLDISAKLLQLAKIVKDE